jgi:hypothetical protein
MNGTFAFAAGWPAIRLHSPLAEGDRNSMKNLYKRFLSTNQSGSNRLADSWAGGESFVVGRATGGVGYNREPGGAGAATLTSSVAAPPGEKKKASFMANSARQLPAMPEIGRPESFYAKLVKGADQQADVHLHESAKVGQYITLALDPSLAWDDKLKYFRHALKRHCVPPPYPDDDVWMFYQQLADLVRQYAGQEALRLSSTEDDLYAARLSMGQSREKIEDDAEAFFQKLMGSGDQCPEWFNEMDWAQLKLIRDQWI